MSRILRRPMFRGGKVIDSRGTGITSGLMNTPSYATGGRVGFKFGNTYTNLTDLRQVLPYNMTGQEIMDKYNVTFPINPKSLFTAENPQAQNIEETSEGDLFFKDGKPDFKKDTTYFLGQGDTQGTMDKNLDKVQLKLDNKGKPVKDKLGNPVYVGSQKTTLPQEGPKGNGTVPPVVSPEDAIRENAELFKELLGEASKEDIKKARIQDASDYLLKFFAGTQREGATVGSAAADVAEFAVSRDSRTDRAKEAAKKTDQTATALAINDYIAGKRSKEEINKLLAGYAAKAEFAKGDTASQIADFAGKQGYLPGVDIIKTYIRDDKALRGKEIVEFDSTKENVSYTTGDENKVFIDKITKKVFTFNKDGKPIEVLFEGLDLDKYYKKPSSSKLNILKDVKEDFCFLYTGHWLPGAFGEDRKNTATLIKTFLETFKGPGRKKPALVLKCNQVNYSLLDKETIIRQINRIRDMVSGNLPNIYLLHGEMTDEEMNQLNNDPKVKAFVSFTKGEGYGRPLAEAAITGKPVIVSNWSGHTDFINKDYNILIGGGLKDVHKSSANQFLLKESQWFSINTDIASRAMKDIFKNYKKYWEVSRKQTQYLKDNWSFDKMTEKLNSLLPKIEPAPQTQHLKLPNLKKVDSKQEMPKLKLPKLKKIEA